MKKKEKNTLLFVCSPILSSNAPSFSFSLLTNFYFFFSKVQRNFSPPVSLSPETLTPTDFSAFFFLATHSIEGFFCVDCVCFWIFIFDFLIRSSCLEYLIRVFCNRFGVRRETSGRIWNPSRNCLNSQMRCGKRRGY